MRHGPIDLLNMIKIRHDEGMSLKPNVKTMVCLASLEVEVVLQAKTAAQGEGPEKGPERGP